MTEPGTVVCPICDRYHTQAKWCPRKIASVLLGVNRGVYKLNHADTQKLTQLKSRGRK